MNKDIKKSTKETEKYIKRKYWEQLKLNKFYFFAPACALVAYIVSTNLTPIFFSEFIGSASRGEYSRYSDLARPLGVLLVLYLVKFILYAIEISIWTETVYRSEGPLLIDGLKNITTKSKSFFADNFSGSLMSRSMNYMGYFQNTLTQYDSNLLPSLASTLFVITYLSYKSKVLLIPFLFTAIVYGLIIAVTRKKRDLLAKELQKSRTEFNGFFSDSISNIEIIKAEGLEAEEISRVTKQMEDFRSAKRRYMMYSNNMSRLTNSISQVLALLSMGFAAVLFIQGKVGLEVVVLMSFYAPTLTGNIFAITDFKIQTQDIFNQTADMAEMMMSEPEIKDPKNPTNLKIEHGLIEFDKANFKYTNSSEEVKSSEEDQTQKSNKKEQAHLFKNLDLTIKPGERIGLVGPSGGGKSTLLKLILRFYDVDSGSIKIDGVNVKDVIQSKLRQQIAYVPQDPALFHRSIGENIGYSKPKAKQSQIEQAAKQAYADEFINTLPDGYDTLVGERGVKLSGGQRQRVAIARAILKDAPILLLDEATSALDSESERYIQKSLEKLMKGRTTVVVAHRLSTIQKMDRILVIDGGKVIASGPHEELLKTSPLYKKLWSHQSGGMLQD
jgi:ATP-binding cassette subfamily B protein